MDFKSVRAAADVEQCFYISFNMESRQHFIVKYERSLPDFHRFDFLIIVSALS